MACAGGEPGQSSSISLSTLTVRPRPTRSMPSTARGLLPPSGSAPSPRSASTAPSTRNCTRRLYRRARAFRAVCRVRSRSSGERPADHGVPGSARSSRTAAPACRRPAPRADPAAGSSTISAARRLPWYRAYARCRRRALSPYPAVRATVRTASRIRRGAAAGWPAAGPAPARRRVPGRPSRDHQHVLPGQRLHGGQQQVPRVGGERAGRSDVHDRDRQPGVAGEQCPATALPPAATTCAPTAAIIAPLSVHSSDPRHPQLETGCGAALLGQRAQPAVGRDAAGDHHRADAEIGRRPDGLGGQHVDDRLLEGRADVGDRRPPGRPARGVSTCRATAVFSPENEKSYGASRGPVSPRGNRIAGRIALARRAGRSPGRPDSRDPAAGRPCRRPRRRRRRRCCRSR